ncbi:hypothetical protein L1049_010758 [Liquidambar formosana]|uniref:methionyl-tRNA formyltransferase n=1 Tax=Liquidambar formosana TaxID=63359 RepID=A0AAP0N305_LIQFO
MFVKLKPNGSGYEKASNAYSSVAYTMLLGEYANNDMFLSKLRALQPELCITAAYGNMLPSKFLKIPPLGAVNIHPSLLPLYRGAAPVQRALQDGVKETGVSLAFNVHALDAGPVIACERLVVDDQVKVCMVLVSQFNYVGSKLLIHELPSIFNGSARVKAQPQDDSKATLAPKITPEESWLCFDQEAEVLHNKVSSGFFSWHNYVVTSHNLSRFVHLQGGQEPELKF